MRYRQHVLRAGQGRRPQEGADLPAEATARDEHEPVDPLGEQVGEHHRDAAAERVADEAHLLDAQPVEQVAQGGRVGAERVVADRLGGLPVAEQVGHDQPVVVVEPVDEVRPLLLRPEDAVDEEQGRARAAVGVGERVPVQGDGALGGRRAHGELLGWADGSTAGYRPVGAGPRGGGGTHTRARTSDGEDDLAGDRRPAPSARTRRAPARAGATESTAGSMPASTTKRASRSARRGCPSSTRRRAAA